jgi:tRNA-dihydrouridine synthase 1
MNSLFANIVPDPVRISLEYLQICEELPNVATYKTIEAHIKHFIEFQWQVAHLRLRVA